MSCDHKFWFEDGRCLFQSFRVFPSHEASLESNCNALSRLIIVLFLILLCIGVVWDVYFILVCFGLLFAFYYIKKCLKKRITKENFIMKQMDNPGKEELREPWGPVEWIFSTPPPPTDSYSYGQKTPIMLVPAQNEGRHAYQPVENTQKEFPLSFTPSNISNPQIIPEDQAHAWWSPHQEPIPYERSIGINQALVGQPNPKTRIKPVIPTPIADWNVWSPNSFVIPRNINDQRRQELFQNGYMVTPPDHGMMREKKGTIESYSSLFGKTSVKDLRPETDGSVAVREDWYSPSFDKQSYINTSCGDNPSNLENNLPINFNAPYDMEDPRMAEYNKNLFSIPLQPGVYTTSTVNQTDASQSNLGISMTQQFLPTTLERVRDDEIVFTEQLPNSEFPVYRPDRKPDDVFRNEVFDPRSYGYGSNNRAYTENMTGQPRFYYDDIDAHSQYNYITRNDLDWASFGTAAGPYEDQRYSNMDIRSQAQDAYMSNQLQFRTELQQRLMHKNSNREWQQRIAPIMTNQGARVGGGMGGGSYAGPRG